MNGIWGVYEGVISVKTYFDLCLAYTNQCSLSSLTKWINKDKIESSAKTGRGDPKLNPKEDHRDAAKDRSPDAENL